MMRVLRSRRMTWRKASTMVFYEGMRDCRRGKSDKSGAGSQLTWEMWGISASTELSMLIEKATVIL